MESGDSLIQCPDCQQPLSLLDAWALYYVDEFLCWACHEVYIKQKLRQMPGYWDRGYPWGWA